MRLKIISLGAGISLLALNLCALYIKAYWVSSLSLLLFIIPLFLFFSTKTKAYNTNLFSFLFLVIIAFFLKIYREFWIVEEISRVLELIAYVFLIREATQHVQRRNATFIMSLYFFVVVAVNFYFFSRHIIEIGGYIGDKLNFLLYIVFYLNYLLLAATALLYYLNSYSRKSVYFLALTLGFIFADVMIDMSSLYVYDLSLEVAGSFLKFASFVAVMLFFTTEERKLRLSNFI